MAAEFESANCGSDSTANRSRAKSDKNGLAARIEWWRVFSFAPLSFVDRDAYHHTRS